MINRVKKIESLLPRAMCADRHAVSLEIMRIKQSGSKTASDEKIIKKLIRLEKKDPNFHQKEIMAKEKQAGTDI